MRRWFTTAFAALVLLVVAGVLGGYAYLRRSLPSIDGVVSVSGLSAPIDIVRDGDAIPHIFAANRLDGLFGLGYVHAQDRLWQMEFQRRIGSGRLSEIFGAATIPQDRFLRTVGFERAARESWRTLPEQARTEINAYVAGINAFLAAHHGSRLPPEFTLLRFEPTAWTGVDVVAWGKMMAWDLSSNYSFELLRDDLARRVGADRMRELMPSYPNNGLNILGGGRIVTNSTSERTDNAETRPALVPASVDSVSSVVASVSTGLPAVRDFLLGNARTEALGSNNWVVDGTLTASGKPMLANDPHLGTRLPSTWYLAHISAGDTDLIGATLPGTPAIALGRNRFIAWGATNVAADVEDLYREHLDPSGRFADFRGAQEPLTIVPERIVVKNHAPVDVQVRITRHGPLVSDAINANNAESHRLPTLEPLEPLAFRWTALDPHDTTIAAYLSLNQASNWAEFTAALRDFVVPSQNFVYADVNGHIGYYAPGRIPIRASGDGSRPADGWTGDAEWTGWVPFDELPHVADPPEHFVVTANNRPAPAGYPYLLGLEWAQPYRAGRIVDLLHQAIATRGAAGRGLTSDDFARIQADTVSPYAQTLLPLLMRHAHPLNAGDQRALDLVRPWNGDARGDSAAAAVFEAWSLELVPGIAGDELGAAALHSYEGKFSFVARFITNVLSAQSDSSWCDNVTTPARETCDGAVSLALDRAVAQLTRLMGSDETRWRWDRVHRAVFPHQGLDTVAALRPLLSRSVPHGGDWSTVNVGTVDVDAPYEQHAAPGFRQVIDLSTASDSRFIDAVGEAGHFLSTHYDDFMTDWQAGRYRRMRIERADVNNGALGQLHLAPPCSGTGVASSRRC